MGQLAANPTPVIDNFARPDSICDHPLTEPAYPAGPHHFSSIDERVSLRLLSEISGQKETPLRRQLEGRSGLSWLLESDDFRALKDASGAEGQCVRTDLFS